VLSPGVKKVVSLHPLEGRGTRSTAVLPDRKKLPALSHMRPNREANPCHRGTLCQGSGSRSEISSHPVSSPSLIEARKAVLAGRLATGSGVLKIAQTGQTLSAWRS
jgi:hypothetical protein